MKRSATNSLEINALLRPALTNRINDRQIYMRGIQQSYRYEDLYDHDINEIDIELKKDNNNKDKGFD